MDYTYHIQPSIKKSHCYDTWINGKVQRSATYGCSELLLLKPLILLIFSSCFTPSVIEKLFVLDVSPVSTAETISSAPIFMGAMRGVTIPNNLELHEAIKMADKLLLPKAGIRMFLLQNLVKKEKEFTWRANLDAIAKNFNDNIAGFPPAKDGKPFHGETYFIGGALSKYLKPSDHDEIKLLFPSAKFSYIEGAGHWLHAEKPKEFLQEITTLLQ
ncbi:Protein ABHD11 [Armadillidium vulgare]|nr:Protein ABHD11 [Armadillidium vulgare]